MKHFAALSLCFITAGASAQLTVTDNLSASSLAQLLEGLNVTISNVAVNCDGAAMGHFSGTSELEIEEGLLLTSGTALGVAASAFQFVSGYPGTPGDPDLEISLGGGTPTYDACVLEFDCIPTGDTLLFNFSFGSEEYPEFVGTFNDVFAIYLTGPGYPMQTNVAALPDGTPVAINNVNAGINAPYFYDNETADGQFVAYDGFTNNLTAFAVVSPEETYHFKVAIADALDGVYDSGVFLEAFSFRSNGLSTGIGENTSVIGLVRNGDQLIAQLPSPGSKAELVIMNAMGGIVQRTRMSSDRTVIELGALSNGFYTVQVPGFAPVRFVKD